MKDLKIRVDNDAESREVQELFFELGYKWFSGGNQVQHIKQSCSSSFGYLVAWSSGCFTDVIQCGCGNEDAKEITLPELRDLVVLKRNDVKDATHTCNGCKYYLTPSEFFEYINSHWKNVDEHVDGCVFEPIEKPMKEYLRKNNDGEYILEVTDEREAQEPHAKHWIEIPEGCNIITCEERKCGLVYFHWKSLDSDEFFLKDEKIWSNNFNETLSDFIEKNEGDVKIIWSRHTLPEELPFIDDEPSLNDQYAEIEKVRQDIINSPNHYADSTIECIDAMEAMMTPEQFIGYLRGNVFKYQWRYEKKNGIEDLKKAQWYLERLTEKVAEKNAPF